MKCYTDHLLRSKGFGLLTRRAIMILTRFGIGVNKIDQCLMNYIGILQKHNIRPTLFVTAVLMERYPLIFRKYFEEGADLACHGLVHTDYSLLTFQQQSGHMAKARKIFERNKLPLTGFRSPYLRSNPDTLQALKENGFEWCSNQVIWWNVFDGHRCKEGLDRVFGTINNFYKPVSERDTVVLPTRKHDAILDIPASLPDDETLVDRLCIKRKEELYDLWRKVFLKIKQRNGLFVHVSHGERSKYFVDSLDALIGYMESLSSVWFASLNEVNRWWKEKESFVFNTTKCDSDQYVVKIDCSDRCLPLLKIPCSSHEKRVFGHYTALKDSSFIFHGKKKPIIGISLKVSSEIADVLHSLGFSCERSMDPDIYEFFVDENTFNTVYPDLSAMLLRIENSEARLLRFWNWPNGYDCAFSCTSDVDSITLSDFILRAREFT